MLCNLLHNIRFSQLLNQYMWQSHVEVEGYSAMCFDRFTMFEVAYRWTSTKGGAHMYFVS